MADPVHSMSGSAGGGARNRHMTPFGERVRQLRQGRTAVLAKSSGGAQSMRSTKENARRSGRFLNQRRPEGPVVGLSGLAMFQAALWAVFFLATFLVVFFLATFLVAGAAAWAVMGAAAGAVVAGAAAGACAKAPAVNRPATRTARSFFIYAVSSVNEG